MTEIAAAYGDRQAVMTSESAFVLPSVGTQSTFITPGTTVKYAQVGGFGHTTLVGDDADIKDPTEGSDWRCRLWTFILFFCVLISASVVFIYYWSFAVAYDSSSSYLDSHTMVGFTFFSLVALTLVAMSSFMCFGGLYKSLGSHTAAAETGCRWSLFGVAFILAMVSVGFFLHHWQLIEGDAVATRSSDFTWPSLEKSTSKVLDRSRMQQLILQDDQDDDGEVNYAEFQEISAHAAELQGTKPLKKEEIEDIFNLLDDDRDGQLNQQELLELNRLAEGGSVRGKPMANLARPHAMMAVAFFSVVFILLMNLIIACSFWSASAASRSVVFSTGESSRWLICFFMFFILVACTIVFVYFALIRGGVKETEIRIGVEPKVYNCNEGLYDWEKEWPHAKKIWCCYHHEKGCPKKVVYDTRFIQGPQPAPRIRYVRGPDLKPPPEVVIEKKLLPVNQKPVVHYHDETVYDIPTPREVIHRKRIIEVPGPAPPPEVVVHHRTKYVEVPAPPPPREKIIKYRWRTVDAPSDLQSCKLWGDPHVVTFDKSHLVFYSEGDFWIVKSPMTKIQGRFQATKWTRENDKTDYSSMTSILIAGRIMGGHKLEVQSMEGKILCNGQEILAGFGTQTCGGATVSYDSSGKLVDSAMSFLPHKVVHITLHDGYWIQVNRWPNFINALVTMRAEGQDGICGNFNGFAGDDSGEELHKRWGHGVASYEDLFSYHLPLHIPKAKPSPTRCGKAKIDRAAHVCTHRIRDASPAWSFAECMGDFCDNARGDGEVSYEAEEMREHYIHAQ
eukprot:TRINITY_DN1543_c0_g1_i5.p1 TRINITY_DN1543_c0_g1~~TRINITY_DN1543_c0_g1_i5.p1  ORF type:complete len:788 (+),score=129.07 TRINITY_DN1543_c0_g1_i5:227-2590(+)